MTTKRERQERREHERVLFHARVSVFCGNEQHTCHLLNLSKQGALLAPDIGAAPNTFIRLNIRLPQLEELLDLDSVVVHDAADRRPNTWGVHFVNPERRTHALLSAFVDWVLVCNTKPGKPKTGNHPQVANLPPNQPADEDDLTDWVSSIDLQELYAHAVREACQKSRKQR